MDSFRWFSYSWPPNKCNRALRTSALLLDVMVGGFLGVRFLGDWELFVKLVEGDEGLV